MPDQPSGTAATQVLQAAVARLEADLEVMGWDRGAALWELIDVDGEPVFVKHAGPGFADAPIVELICQVEPPPTPVQGLVASFELWAYPEPHSSVRTDMRAVVLAMRDQRVITVTRLWGESPCVSLHNANVLPTISSDVRAAAATLLAILALPPGRRLRLSI